MSCTCPQGWPSMTETSGQQRQAATRTACLIGQVAGRVPRAASESPRRSRGHPEALLPHHARGVQTRQMGVGFSQPCCQDVQVMSPDVIDRRSSREIWVLRARYRREPRVQRDRARHTWRISRNAASSGRGLATRSITVTSLVATVAKRRPRYRHRPQTSSATLDCCGRWTSTRTLASSRAPLRRTEIGEPRPPRTDEAFDAAGLCVRTVPITGSVGGGGGLDPHRTGGEAHSSASRPLRLNRGNQPSSGALAGTGGLPVPVGVHRAVDSVGVGLFRAFGPPHRTCVGVRTHVVFDRVPPFPQHPKRRLRRLNSGREPRFDIGFRAATVQLYALRRAPKCRASELA